MVMESPPSPKCVGREFVRQYYTLLNNAPTHLHRFYNTNSSFIHGGPDPQNRETTPVVGQKQIHQKIQQLNFRDCHAKITQVDSQATLSDGVVVQVTGELSNGGQPMRRFTQTFVLAFLAPKKYYVHNDIFRYQDMLTEEEYEMSRNDIDEDHQAALQQQNNNHTTTTTTNNTSTQVEEDRDDWSSQPMVNGTSESHHHEATPTEIPQSTPAPPIPQPIHHTPQPMHPTQTQPVQPIHQAPATQPIVTPVIQPVPTPQPTPPPQLETSSAQQESTPATHHHHTPIEQEEEPYSQTEMEPLATSPLNNSGKSSAGGEVVTTYANLVKGSSGGPTAVSGPQSPVYTTPLQPQPTSPTGGVGRVDRPKPRESRTYVRSDENFPTPNTNPSESVSSYDMDRGKKPYHDDSQQLFMGNLPHYATEDKLKGVFGRFGTIIEMRILGKGAASKSSSGKVPPNYGFVVFEQPSSVQAVLNAKPILYPDDSGTRLNVEEKKTKGSGGGVGGGRGGGPRGGSRGGGSMNGPPRGPLSRTGGQPPTALTQRQNYNRR